MKNFYYFLVYTMLGFQVQAQTQNATFTVSPASFNETDQITITVSGIDVTQWNSSDVYLWAWYYDLNDVQVGDSPTNGSWTNSDPSQQFTDNGNGTYSITFTPSVLFNDTGIGKIGVLAKTDDGSGQTQDHFFEVGVFQLQLNNPTENITVLNGGDILNISATSSLSADFELFANGTSVQTQTATTSFNYNFTVSQNTNFELTATSASDGTILTETFSAIVAPTPNQASVPTGMVDGINFDPNNPTTATLVLYAPGKQFVHVIGNFNGNNWTIDNAFLMNYDTATERHWITLNNLTQNDILFQYFIEGSIRVADPYSEYILDEFNDPYIDALTFSGIPAYPSGQTNFMVSWFQTNPTQYQWQTTNFQRPAQENLVVYELLIRDFITEHSYDALITKLDYLENLGVNAIELMPVSEFDGNISWGYNPAFHMALDKYYGNKNDFKAFVDAAHVRGIAVILDVVYNHATGQNPYYRMWNDCNGCYTGTPTPENPFFNVSDPNTAFQFFNDIDHESPATQAYIDRMNEYWLTEYHIDGFRFDFTKGFTNTPGDGGSFDQARIDILKRMYNEIRAVDQTAYVILEHFAPNSEETVLINHRATAIPEEKGMMVWSNHNYNYNEATMGYNSNSDFSSINYQTRGWTTPSNVAYFESHDEERLMYKNLQYGDSNGSYDITNLNTALSRMETAGAFFFTVPGPKMIWQFGELGYDYSINYCEDGTIDPGCRTAPKPIHWDYFTVPERVAVYAMWSQLIHLKLTEPVFSTSTFSMDVANPNGLKSIHLTNNAPTANTIDYVVVLGNFGLVQQNIDPQFQETGSWFNLLTGAQITVSNVNDPITLAPGEYLVLGSEEALSSESYTKNNSMVLYPNPAGSEFMLSEKTEKIEIYSLHGKLVKTFDGNFSAGHRFEIAELSQGIYLVKAGNDGKTMVSKLVIE